MYDGDALTTMQDSTSPMKEVNNLQFSQGLDFTFDQFADNNDLATALFQHPRQRSLVNLESISNAPPENGLHVCKTCLEIGDNKFAYLKNKSELK